MAWCLLVCCYTQTTLEILETCHFEILSLGTYSVPFTRKRYGIFLYYNDFDLITWEMIQGMNTKWYNWKWRVPMQIFDFYHKKVYNI